MRAAAALRVASLMAFLGLSVHPATAEWGAMIQQGAEYLLGGQWWVAMFPGIALVLCGFGLHLLGSGLDDRLAPRLHARAAARHAPAVARLHGATR